MNTKTTQPFIHLKGVLSTEEIQSIRSIYSQHASKSQLPCYAFIDLLDSPIHQKISKLISDALGLAPFYLNDFFFHTSTSFSTPWHVDTELYLFKSAVNAWILLEPDQISNPLGFINEINSPSADTTYHSVETEDDTYVFVDYLNSKIEERDVSSIENDHISTPLISVGDILLLDPARFHRTNTTKPKGACIFKYIISDDSNLVRDNHLPEIMWPELSLYKRMYDPTKEWSDFLKLVKQEISTNSIKSPFISGFYPDNFPYLIKKATSLA